MFLSSEYGISAFVNPHGLSETRIFHKLAYGSSLNSLSNLFKSIFGNKSNGFIVYLSPVSSVLLFRISKCKCGTLDPPLVPVIPITVFFVTISPGFT